MGTLTVPELTSQLPTGQTSSRRPSLVIADGGHRAALVRLPDGFDLRAGSRFRHAGAWWEVRHCRTHARVWVAEPVESPDAC